MTQKEITTTYIDNIKFPYAENPDCRDYDRLCELLIENLKLANSFGVKCIQVYQQVFVDKTGEARNCKLGQYTIKIKPPYYSITDYLPLIKSSIEFSYKLCEILKQYEYVYKIIVEPKTVYKNADGTIIESGEIDLNTVKKENFIHSSNILNVTIRGVKYGEKAVEA